MPTYSYWMYDELLISEAGGKTLDLLAAAKANVNRLEDQFNTLVASCSPPELGLLQQFANDVVANGRVAINMRPWIAADFVHNNRYQNMYATVAEEAELSGRSPNELLRERLGTFFETRTTFDSSFDRGARFQYGALNIGGAGATRYGIFCVVLNRDFSEDCELVVYLKTDSLSGYMAAGGTLEEAALGRDIAPDTHRQQLAALKHAHELELHDGNWAKMLCSENEYIEVIFVVNLETGMVAEVRIAEHNYQELWDLCFNSHGRALSPGEKALAFDFLTMLRAARDGTITLCEVANA